MTNYLVFVDLYEGSALTEISEALENGMEELGIKGEVIYFEEKINRLKSETLDDPDTFFRHNIRVLNELKGKLQDGDKVLFVDFFQPSLELLYYYLQTSKINVKFGSLFHGASFLPEDYFNKYPWMKNFDKGLMDLMDIIYVPSEFTKKYFDTKSLEKIKCFPYLFNPEKFKLNLNKNKKYDVIIPHRWSWEKDPEFYCQLVQEMPELTFAVSGFGERSDNLKLKELFDKLISNKNVVNLGVKSNKDHFSDLRESKIVMGTQDLFGYSVRKAVASGCIPVLINNFAYPESFDKKSLFNNLEEAKEKISLFLQSYPKEYKAVKKTDFKLLLEDFYAN